MRPWCILPDTELPKLDCLLTELLVVASTLFVHIIHCSTVTGKHTNHCVSDVQLKDLTHTVNNLKLHVIDMKRSFLIFPQSLNFQSPKICSSTYCGDTTVMVCGGQVKGTSLQTLIWSIHHLNDCRIGGGIFTRQSNDSELWQYVNLNQAWRGQRRNLICWTTYLHVAIWTSNFRHIWILVEGLHWSNSCSKEGHSLIVRTIDNELSEIAHLAETSSNLWNLVGPPINSIFCVGIKVDFSLFTIRFRWSKRCSVNQTWLRS